MSFVKNSKHLAGILALYLAWYNEWFSPKKLLSTSQVIKSTLNSEGANENSDGVFGTKLNKNENKNQYKINSHLKDQLLSDKHKVAFVRKRHLKAPIAKKTESLDGKNIAADANKRVCWILLYYKGNTCLLNSRKAEINIDCCLFIIYEGDKICLEVAAPVSVSVMLGCLITHPPY